MKEEQKYRRTRRVEILVYRTPFLNEDQSPNEGRLREEEDPRTRESGRTEPLGFEFQSEE